jgi:hypothetical protein
LELIKVGFYHPRKIYLAYYDGSSFFGYCGNGSYPPERPGVLGAIYLQGTFGDANEYFCTDSYTFAPDEISAGYLEISMLHEALHLLGAAPSCGSSVEDTHTTDSPQDLLYGGVNPWEPNVLDVGNDDYWMHGLPDCPDLAQSVFVDPIPESPQLPPSWSPDYGVYPPIVQLEPVFSTTCTLQTGEASSVRFWNYSSEVVEVFWRDFACFERLYTTLDPNFNITIDSYGGHVWIVRYPDRRFVGEITLPEGASTMFIQ